MVQGIWTIYLYSLAHVVDWESYHLHDVGHFSWVGAVLHRSYATPLNGRLRSTVDYIDRDISNVCKILTVFTLKGLDAHSAAKMHFTVHFSAVLRNVSHSMFK